jgi:hypothetical protein
VALSIGGPLTTTLSKVRLNLRTPSSGNHNNLSKSGRSAHGCTVGATPAQRGSASAHRGREHRRLVRSPPPVASQPLWRLRNAGPAPGLISRARAGIRNPKHMRSPRCRRSDTGHCPHLRHPVLPAQPNPMMIPETCHRTRPSDRTWPASIDRSISCGSVLIGSDPRRVGAGVQG